MMTPIKPLRFNSFKAFKISKIPKLRLGPHVARTMQKWVYNAQSDDKTCPDCSGLDGQTVDVEDVSDFLLAFPYGEADGPDLFLPKVHPNCRCELVLVETYWEE